MKKFKSIFAILAVALTAATAFAQGNALRLQQYNAAGDATKYITVPVATNSVLVTGGNYTPTFAPRSDFATPQMIASAITSHTAAANPHAQYALLTDSRFHAHANKSAIDKITEGSGLPLWNGGAWPGDSAWSQSGANISYTAGNVGIGTGSPTATFHVASGMAKIPNGSVTAGSVAPGLAFSSYADSGIAANSDNLAIWESGVIALNLSNAGKEFRVPSDYKFCFAASTNNNTGSDTSFQRAAAGVLKTPGSFLVDGKIGVGNASPVYKLDVSGDINFTGNIYKNGSVWDPSYTLPTASASTLGGVKIGSGLAITNGVLSTATETNGATTRTVITASGNFTVPKTGYYRVSAIGGGGAGGGSHSRGGGAGGTTSFGSVSAIGGGGGGGAGYYQNVSRAGAGGGGAGQVTVAYVSLTAGQIVSVSIGGGGAPSAVDSTAPAGTNCGANGGGAATWRELCPGYGAKGAQHGGDTGAETGIAGIGGNGGSTGLGYGGGGGGGGGNSELPAKGGWGMDGGATGEDGSTTLTHISNGGAGGAGAVILEY